MGIDPLSELREAIAEVTYPIPIAHVCTQIEHITCGGGRD